MIKAFLIQCNSTQKHMVSLSGLLNMLRQHSAVLRCLPDHSVNHRQSLFHWLTYTDQIRLKSFYRLSTEIMYYCNSGNTHGCGTSNAMYAASKHQIKLIVNAVVILCIERIKHIQIRKIAVRKRYFINIMTYHRDFIIRIFLFYFAVQFK